MKIITKAIETLMDKHPLYSQDGKGDNAKVLFKAFNPYGGETWYVLEASAPNADGDRELFVLSPDGFGGCEYGYMMLSDITKTKVRVGSYYLPLERDMYFKGTVADAKRDMHIA